MGNRASGEDNCLTLKAFYENVPVVALLSNPSEIYRKTSLICRNLSDFIEFFSISDRVPAA